MTLGRAALLAITVSATLLGASILYVGASHADDTFIYMRYADNLIRGNGLSFNPHEKSHGITSAVWALLMLGPAILLGNTVAVWKGVSWAAYGLLCLWTSWWVLSRVRNTALGLMLVMAILIEPHLFRWSGSGMENSLAALSILALSLGWRSVLLARDNGAQLGPVLGILPFVRPELGLLAALVTMEWALLARSRGEWTGFVRALAVAVAVAACLAGAMYWMTGFWLPQTAVAKGLAATQSTPTYAMERTALILGSGAGLFVPAGIWLLTFSRVRPLVRPTLVFIALVWSYLAWQNHLVSTRYSVSINFPLMVAVGLATIEIAHDRLAMVWPAFAGQMVIAVTVLSYTFPGTRTSEGDDIRRFADRAKAVTDATARIAISEVGAFGFFSNRYVIDTVGLVDPQTVAWLRQNGPVVGQAELEELLNYRDATHFVESSASTEPLRGRAIKFVPVLTGSVRRNFESGWDQGLWRLYRLERP